MFIHVEGATYRIVDGVRRTQAALLAGHLSIPAVVFSPQGLELGECELPIESLLSSRQSIPRISAADETRWQRAVEGAAAWPPLFPPISVIPGKRGWPSADVGFDEGDVES